MDHAAEKNNRVFLMGEIVSEATFSHEVYGEGFYEFFVRVMRLSGQADVLPVTISERLIEGNDLKVLPILAADDAHTVGKLVEHLPADAAW